MLQGVEGERGLRESRVRLLPLRVGQCYVGLIGTFTGTVLLQHVSYLAVPRRRCGLPSLHAACGVLHHLDANMRRIPSSKAARIGSLLSFPSQSNTTYLIRFDKLIR